MGQMVKFKTPGEGECTGYYVEPADAGAPGMVVIQEWWGLNDQIKGVANKLAAAGYRALAPDLYQGKVGVEVAEAEHLMNQLNFGHAASQEVRGAVQYLKKSSAKVGVTGFCMGGALTILSAVHVPELDAAVCWYGFPPIDHVDASRITAPIQGHFAKKDAFFPIAQVDALEQKLKELNVVFEFHRYDAQHAFANETALNLPIPAKYDPPSAELAWQRTMDFLKRTIGNV